MYANRTRWRCLTASVAIAAIFLAGSSLAAEALVARGGRADAVIVVGQDSGPFDRWVADELQRYLQNLSGAEFSIVTSDQVPPENPLVIYPSSGI